MNVALFSVILLWSVAEISRFPAFACTDPREIVVDEFLGMYCALIIASTLNLLYIGQLFACFRLIDRCKVFPFNIIQVKLGDLMACCGTISSSARAAASCSSSPTVSCFHELPRSRAAAFRTLPD